MVSLYHGQRSKGIPLSLRVHTPSEKSDMEPTTYTHVNLLWIFAKLNAGPLTERKVRYGKVKLSLCLTKHHSMKTYWGVEV
jgi:hypothetical protein